MKKYLLLVLCAALITMCLTACGDSSSAADSEKTESSSSAETTTTTATTTQTTTTTKTETGVSAETIDEFANAYASTPHVQNCNRETSSSYYTRQAAMSDDGSMCIMLSGQQEQMDFIAIIEKRKRMN